MSGTYYRPGDNKSCCPVCGKEYRASEYRKRWDGLWVCPKDYEERHPQDFLRVKADDMRPSVVAGCCGADGLPQIATSEAPLCPFPLEPLDNTILSSATTVSLSWSTFAGVASYQIFLWEDGDPQPTSATYTTTTSPYFVTGLSQDTGYNWYVTAVGEDGEARDCSGNARFFTTALPLLACPELVSPADEFSFEGASVTLDWNAVSGAASYNVYVFPQNGPRQLVTNTTGTSYEVTGLDLGVTYFWTVTAVNASGESSACGLRLFSTENTVLLSASSYTAYDNEGYATIVVLRNGSVGAVTADYATSDDTAVAPENYTETNGTVSWPDGDFESRPVQIPIEPLELVVERESDKLYPWIVGAEVTDPRNDLNDHEYVYAGQSLGISAPANRTTASVTFPDETTSDSLLTFKTEWELQLPSKSVGPMQLVAHRAESALSSSRGVSSTQIGPYDTIADHELERITLHFNELTPFEYERYGAQTGGLEVAHYLSVGATRAQSFYRAGNGRHLGCWYAVTSGSPGGSENGFGSFDLNRVLATESTTGFLSGGTTVLTTIDAMVECRRIPVAPPIPGSEFPDWPIDPANFWYDADTDTLYSKAPWVRTDGLFRWLALYATTGTPVVVNRYPLSPVLVQGSAEDTQAFWEAAYAADQASADPQLPAGMTYNAAGTGGVTTYPRNTTYAWVRSYKLPLWFDVNLSNAIGAELIEPDSAKVYILPA